MTATKEGRQEAEQELLTYLVSSPHEIADFDAMTLGKPFADPDVRKAYQAIADLPTPDYEATMHAVAKSSSILFRTYAQPRRNMTA